MIAVGVWPGDESARESDRAGWTAPAGLARDGRDLSLLQRPARSPWAGWEQLASQSEQAARLGLGLLVMPPAGTRVPDDWCRQLRAGAVCAWIAQDGQGGWHGAAFDGGEERPVDRVVALDSGEVVDLTDAPLPAPELAPGVWDAIRAGIGSAFARIRASGLLVVGSGRMAGRTVEIAVSSGFWDICVLDNDIDEPRNRTGPLGTKPREPMPKPRHLARYVRDHFEGVRLREETCSVTQRPALRALRDRPLLITATDSEAARFVGACVASALGIAHLDLGAGVHEEGEEIRRAGQVVFIPPGQGCLVCVRGLRWDEVERDLQGDADAQLEARRRGERRGDTMGSVPDLLARVAGAGVALLRRWMGGEEGEARRLLLYDGGLAEELPRSLPQQRCPVCALRNCGQALLNCLFPSPGLTDRSEQGTPDEQTSVGLPLPAADVERVLDLMGAAHPAACLRSQGAW